MLEDLIEAIQIGREAGNLVKGLYNGDHYDAVDKAYEMAQSLDVNDHYEEGVREILDILSVVDKNDRDFVKAAAYDLRARCYFDLGDYAKARQNITACLNIQIDSFTLEKDCIIEHQKAAGEILEEIKSLFADSADNSNRFKMQSTIDESEQEYLDELKECLADGEIGAGERRLLNKLATNLGISPERAAELEASLTPELTDKELEYLDEYKAVIVDGFVSEKERRLLDKLKKMYGISDNRAREIESFAGNLNEDNVSATIKETNISVLASRLGAFRNDMTSKPKSKHYRINPDYCVACGTCQGECPIGAISEGEVYTIDSDICLGCGTCADACPMGAISVDE